MNIFTFKKIKKCEFTKDSKYIPFEHDILVVCSSGLQCCRFTN